MTIMMLPYSDSSLPIEIPDAWLGEVAAPFAVAPAADAAAEARRALAEPAGSPPLEQLARPGPRVAILVDDYTRSTPFSSRCHRCWSHCTQPAAQRRIFGS